MAGADDDGDVITGQPVHEPPDLSKDGGRDADDLGDADEVEEEVDDEDEDENSGELVYELAEWLPEQRVELSMLLESAGVAYNWDGPDLTVAEEYETEVDGLFEQVHGLLDDDDEARYRSIEELFGAVDRLANDPGQRGTPGRLPRSRRSRGATHARRRRRCLLVARTEPGPRRRRSTGQRRAQRGRLARVGSPGRDAPRDGLTVWTATACCSPQGRAQVATNPLS